MECTILVESGKVEGIKKDFMIQNQKKERKEEYDS